jgi:hypothetical protein
LITGEFYDKLNNIMINKNQEAAYENKTTEKMEHLLLSCVVPSGMTA